uniref:Uncharacterized protein n=1 Tax=Candidatus Kentrum sp. DK TaxID=2126562 RepID=A0A450TP83_9GAMM|nr:MAG: hypothetical protein BECKDK2373B_GA0170837_12512 [Candidatus Kentron sp. DK]
MPCSRGINEPFFTAAAGLFSTLDAGLFLLRATSIQSGSLPKKYPLPAWRPALPGSTEQPCSEEFDIPVEKLGVALQLYNRYCDVQPEKLVGASGWADYSATDRVKRQLSYRLGTTLIERSKSLNGWLGMPWALQRQVREFRREQKEQGNATLPPLSRYADAVEAERYKQHLSYRLGGVMIAHAKTPLGACRT